MAIFIFILLLVSAVVVFGHRNIAKLILGLGAASVVVFCLLAVGVGIWQAF